MNGKGGGQGSAPRTITISVADDGKGGLTVTVDPLSVEGVKASEKIKWKAADDPNRAPTQWDVEMEETPFSEGMKFDKNKNTGTVQSGAKGAYYYSVTCEKDKKKGKKEPKKPKSESSAALGGSPLDDSGPRIVIHDPGSGGGIIP